MGVVKILTRHALHGKSIRSKLPEKQPLLPEGGLTKPNKNIVL
jgi:hypothetical protein